MRCNNNQQMNWLVDMGSRRSFINSTTAKQFMSANTNIHIVEFNENKGNKYSNNKDKNQWYNANGDLVWRRCPIG